MYVEEDEQVGRAIALVLVVVTLELAGLAGIGCLTSPMSWVGLSSKQTTGRFGSLQTIATSHVEEFGADCHAPSDAIVHFQGDDPELGPVLRYTVIKPMRA